MEGWKDLALLSEEELAKKDVAVLNLACAAGLPGINPADGPKCLARLDDLAAKVHRQTIKFQYQFNNRPDQFKNCEAYFRALVMVSTLQRDCGIRYHPGKRDEHVPLEPVDCFIQGPLLGEGGTCSSLPVVYAAVGRRLGYPLKLASATTRRWGHSFMRWEKPDGNHFNIETTCTGLVATTDDHYKTGDYWFTPEHGKYGNMLRSMSPRQELACFMQHRCFCFLEAQCFRSALEALAWACGMDTANQMRRNTFRHGLKQWKESLDARKPALFPEVLTRLRQRRFPGLPYDLERDWACLVATENLLHNAEYDQKYWQPMRMGSPYCQRPIKAFVESFGKGAQVRLELAPPLIAAAFSVPTHFTFDCGTQLPTPTLPGLPAKSGDKVAMVVRAQQAKILMPSPLCPGAPCLTPASAGSSKRTPSASRAGTRTCSRTWGTIPRTSRIRRGL